MVRRFRRPLLIIFSVIGLFIALTILLISPLTKYAIEKYDEKYTGRQIEINWAYVNPFTGYIYLSELKIFELNSDSVFFSAEGVSADFAIRKLLFKTYEINRITLDQPQGTIIQTRRVLNFDDLIARFSSKNHTGKPRKPVHFNILSIKINEGEFYYIETVTPINYHIKKVNIESSGFRWDADTIASTFAFLSGIGTGSMNGNFTINIKTLGYRLAVKIRKFDLNILEQYLKDIANYGYFKANLDAALNVKGNFKTAENVTFSGTLAINEFHSGKNPEEDYASFDKLSLAIFELSPLKHKYLFDSVSLSNPYFKYERYSYLDNYQHMFGRKKPGSTGTSTARSNLIVIIGNYIKELSKNFFRSNYKVNNLAIYNGNLEFSDFSLGEKFNVEINPINLVADSINKTQKRVSLTLITGIKPFGNATVTLSINPADSSDFDLHYHLQKLPVSLFNPYTIHYTSYPLDRGTIELKGTWNVRNGRIKSDNHLLIIDPCSTKRVRNKDTKWIPVPLIMSFVRERGNVIDYDIPITGNLNDPKFSFRDVISDILGNIFIKPPTTAYGIQINNIETEIERSLTLKWRFRSSSIPEAEQRFIKKISGFLQKNPEATIEVYPKIYAAKEREYLLFFEAKKKFFLETNRRKADTFSEKDSVQIEKLSVNDEKFVRYLNEQTNDSMLFTIQDKCSKLIGISLINHKYNHLSVERKEAFLLPFREQNTESQIKILESESTIPYNGFSYYKISYKGEFPESLKKAYNKLNRLNDEIPRKQFKKERKKNRIRL